ncbi:MAG: OmpA family protein [Deltaproteobacteria bacterium]|nr:OmpA family protein [Deltaproteobacteria bacterium]
MRPSLALVLSISALAVLASARGANAQRAPLNRFSASETPEDDFHLSRPTDLGHLRWGAQLHLDYAHDPLVWEGDLGDAGSEEHRIVDHQFNATVGLSLGLFDRLVIYAGVPITLEQAGDDPADLLAAGIDLSADGPGVGDAYLGARLRIFGEADDPAAIGLQVTGTFPTAGNDQRLLGDEFLTIHPELLFEGRLAGSARIVFDAGVRIRENTSSASNLAFGDELTFGLGFVVPVWSDEDGSHLDLHAQVYGSTTFEDAFTRETTPFEGILGAKFFHETGVIAGLGAGPGLTRGFGSPDVRAVAMVGYTPPVEREAESVEPVDTDGDGLTDDVDECPREPEDVDEFEDTDGCPDPDNDQDGVLDPDDQCPLEPEDRDGNEDEDGCVDPDDDGDGILDVDDECRDQPEDVDQFEDEDGCPDPDNDGDGVLDSADGCPMEAGPPANHGCPDADRDGDTVVDRLDNCPDEPGPPENQGCERRQQVRIQEGRLEILDKVYFRTNRSRIQRRSYALLLNVAEVLNAHPEIDRVRVEGHTDTRGRREYNVDLSQRRAEAVVEFLVERGEVAAERLVARGFGPDRPIVEDAQSRDDHARNRRVEFNIESGGEGIEQRDSGPSEDTMDASEDEQ